MKKFTGKRAKRRGKGSESFRRCEDVQNNSKKVLTLFGSFDIFEPHTEQQQTNMRTKTLLLSAALVAVGLVTSVAQTVYSVNAVGYVNVTLVAGYNLLNNPLNGTNNNLNTIIPTAPESSVVLRWDAAAQGFNPSGDTYFGGSGWLNDDFLPTDTVLNPGQAFFLRNVSGAPATVTFVGEVPQGSLTNRVPVNYGFLGSIVPQSAGLTALGFPPLDGMEYLGWNKATQGYDYGHSVIGGVWYDDAFNQVDPTPAVAEGFLIKNSTGSAVNWTRTFSVNN
jgi:hypothetical protein